MTLMVTDNTDNTALSAGYGAPISEAGFRAMQKSGDNQYLVNLNLYCQPLSFV